MIKLLLHESKRRVGSPGVFITPGTYFIYLVSELGVNLPKKKLGRGELLMETYACTLYF